MNETDQRTHLLLEALLASMRGDKSIKVKSTPTSSQPWFPYLIQFRCWLNESHRAILVFIRRGSGGVGVGAVWNDNKGRQTAERRGQKPQSRRGRGSTYLEVCDLIKAKLVYANKSEALVIWYYYAHISCHGTRANVAPRGTLLAPSKLSKVERTVINIVMSNNSGGSGHCGGLIPKQTSQELNNYIMRSVITASSDKKIVPG